MIKEGTAAPAFTLNDADGRPISLDSFRSKKVVIYFYPKDDTPGCTVEACAFRDVFDDFLDAGAVVLGISPDDAASHVRFRNKFNLPFHLLSDPDHVVAEAYGTWGEKNAYGKKSMGILRSTFVVDEGGIVRKVFPKVRPDGHAEEVLAVLRA